MRLEQSIQEDPVTDCLAQIPKLTYTYLENNNTGEARFHEDALTVFRNTLVWVSETEDETQAIWFTRPADGKTWLKNIIKELNLVISQGKGPQRTIMKISITLKNLENNHRSQTMTDFLKRFKTTAHDTRVEALKLKYTNEEVDRMLRTTPTAYPGRLRDPPTDQLAITPYNQNRRDRRRAAREGQGQGGQIQYANNVYADRNRNTNPNPILLRQTTPNNNNRKQLLRCNTRP